MATSYTGLRVQDTYNAIIKIGDNSNLSATPKLLSDGVGNDTPLYLSGTRLGIGITPSYQFHTSGNAKIGGNLIISGNLTVNGTLTYLNVEDLAVEDPIIKLAKDNTANTLDIGLFGKYVATGTKYKGFFNDASDDKFKLFIGTTVEPTTTVNTSATGYTVGTLVANLEGNVTGNADTATGVLITADSANTSRRMVFTESSNATDTDGRLFKDSASNFFYNPSTNLLTVSNISSISGTFSGDVTANHYFADTHFRSTDTNATLSTTGVGTVYLRPEGYNIVTNQATLSGGTFTLNGVNPEIAFNGSSDTGVDMAIKATPEGLDFYEPEQSDKIHFQILDDTGVNAVFGYRLNGTMVIDASRNLTNIGTGNFSGQVTIPETPTADGHAASKKYVDDNTGTADVAKRIDVTVKNVSGGSLAKGVVVHASPTATPPSGNVIEVIAADANVASSMPGIGVLNETIADQAEGEAVMFGAVSGIDTSGFSIGDELYVSETVGLLTATKPTAFGSQVQKIAVVIKSHASNGLIKVFGAGRANDVPNRVDRDMNFTDDSELTFGDSSDLKIYHTTNNIVRINSGDLIFNSFVDDGDIKFQLDNGSDPASLTEYMRLDGGEVKTIFSKSTRHNDSVKSLYGTNDDLEIYHDGTDGYIDNINGELIIQNNSNDKKIIFKSDNGIGDITEYFRIDGNINRNVITVTTQLNDNVPLIFGSGAGRPSIKYDSTASQLFIGGTAKFLDNVISVGNIETTNGVLNIYKSSETSSSATGTTLLSLTNNVGSDLSQQKTFIDFNLLDTNDNEYPQVRIGAEVGQNGDANSQTLEGCGAFLVYTNNATGNGPGTPTGLAENLRVDFSGTTTTPKIRLTSTADASITSTEHGFQVGTTDSANIIADGNEIMARNNSAVSELNLNPDGGDVTFGGNVNVSTMSGSGNLNVYGHTTTTELNLPSSGMVDWANGDARIVEGLVNNFSLSFQTYDGTNVTTALRLDGDNTATFAGQVKVTSDIFLNPDYVNANEYLYLRKHQSADGGILFQSKTSGDVTQSDWQIVNHGATGDLKFYAYGLAGHALTLDRENGNATFAGTVTATSFSGPLTGNVTGNVTGNLTGIASNLTVNANDTFNGTYPLLWHAGNVVYSSSFMTINGSTDTLSVPNISVSGDLNVDGTINLDSTVNIEGGGDALFLKQSVNAAFASIKFSDDTNDTQFGFIKYTHADVNSRGGGSSLWLTGQNDHCVVVGDGTNTGRIVVSTQNSVDEVDYGFYNDLNTGMYQPAENQLGLVVNGTRVLQATPTVFDVQNVPIKTIQGTAAAPGIGIGDNDSGFYDAGANEIGVTLGGTVQTIFKPNGIHNSQGNGIYNGSYMYIGSGSANYMGTIGFNRNTSDGTIFNTSFGAYQIHNNNGTLKLQGYNTAGTNQFEHQFFNDGDVFVDGQLGVGVSSADATVHISNVSNNTQLMLERTGTSTGKFQIYTNTNSLFIYDKAQSQHRIKIDSSGRVGIGTVNPTRNLTIGDGSGNSVLAIVAATNGLSQIGLGDSDDDNYGQIILRHSDGLLQIQNGGGGGISERGLNITSDEKVGIGITAPTADIHIKRSGDASIIIEADSDNVGENDNPTLFLRQDGAIITSRYGINGDANNQFTGAIGNAAYIHSAGAFQIAPDGGLISATFKDGAMLIDGTGGEVPSYKLDIRNAGSSGINISGSYAFLRWNSGDMQIRNAGGYTMGFDTWNGTALTQKMTISGGGTVHANTRMDIGSQTWTGYGSNPIAKLNVGVNGGEAINIFNNQENYASLSFIDSQSNGTQSATIEWSSGSGNPFKITNMGNVPIYILDSGNVGIKKTTGISYALDVTGDIRASADVIAFSDKRVKKDIKTIDNALEKVTKLRGVSYKRSDVPDNKTKIGVIAQEVKEVLPEVVSKDDQGLYAVSYGKMAGVFIEAIKDLKAEVDSLKQEIKELKK